MSPDVAPSRVGGSDTAYVVTLIHGTFAADAAWPKDGSPLRGAVSKKLAGSVVEFAPYRWSGGNSHRARIEAGLGLRRFLREQVRKHPKARHFIIAHSHGGNVSLYGLRRSRAREKVAGVISLGTPFICCEPVDLPEVARRWRRRFTRIALLAAVVAARSALPEDLVPWEPSWAWDWIGPYSWPVLAVSLLAALVTRYLFDPKGPMVRRWAKDQARRYRHLQAPRDWTVPLLCVATGRDEARFALDLTEAVAKGSGGVAKLLNQLVTLVSILVTSIAALAVGLGAWFVYFGLTQDFEPGSTNGIGFVLMGALLVVFAGFPFLILTSYLLAYRMTADVAVPAVQRTVKDIGFGRLRRRTHSLLSITQQIRPPGGIAHQLEFAKFRIPIFSRDQFKRHSRLYTDPDVLDLVSSWIVRTAADRPSSVADLR